MMTDTLETTEAPAEKKPYAEVVLPSGKRATLPREPMGHDMEKAYEIAGVRASNMVSLAMALFSQVGKLNGERVAYEELRHGLSALDSYRLAAWANAGFPALDAPGAAEQEPSASPL